MELILNFAWMMLALTGAGLWMRHARRNGVTPRMQAVALLMLMVVLLPVISVTDDLQALQNPAELDCCARRHHAGTALQPIFPVVAALPSMAVAEASFSFLCRISPGGSSHRAVRNPALASIQNRPPPSA
jgi:hypothetical protein